MEQQASGGLSVYALECARLFYWAYFKPYTFRRWLRAIHPEPDMGDNPFRRRAESYHNPRLRRYSGQVWWLAAVVPTLAVLIIGHLYSLFAAEAFDWLTSIRFLLGWWVGLWLARSSGGGGGGRGADRFIGSMVVLAIVLGGLSQLAPGTLEYLFQFLPKPLAVGLFELFPQLLRWWPVAFGVAGGVVFAVVFVVAGGVAFGAASDVARGVGGGVVVGVTVGVVFGVAGGMAFGVTWVLGVLRLYFWLPEMAWALILAILTWQKGHARWLPYLPPYFDQLIVLPLPFMAELIAQAYRENQAAARGAINYLITSTNQQGVAAQAITDIAINSLARCETARDIAALADQLAWVPSPPPEALGPVLPQFLEISQDVRAALAATSPYRQGELLVAPLRALHALRESLAFAPAWQATALGSTLDRWLRILETARRTLAERARETDEIHQAYVAGPALDPETAGSRFKGRVDLFREVEKLLLAPQCPVLLLYGGRRTGKTSVLKYLPRRVGSDFIPLLVDIQGVAAATTLGGVAESLVLQIVEAARRSRNVRLPFPDPGSIGRDPFVAVQRWMDQVEKIVGTRRLLLCLDEYERLDEVVKETHSRAPLNWLRHVMQHRPHWALLFSGSHLPDELLAYWSDYLINTEALRVSYLDEADARELIQSPIEGFPDIYAEEAVQAILRLTRGQPYLIQLICYELIEHLNQHKQRRAALHDVEAVLPSVFDSGYHYFREFWEEGLTVEQRQYLAALVQGRGVDEGVRAVPETLVSKEVLERTGDAYRFQVPLIHHWVEWKTKTIDGYDTTTAITS